MAMFGGPPTSRSARRCSNHGRRGSHCGVEAGVSYTQFFPTALIVLDIGASIVYAVALDWLRFGGEASGCLQDFTEPKCSGRCHSGLMLAARITLPHFSVSSAMYLPKSADEPPNGEAPTSASRALSVGSARPALTSLLSCR